MNEEIIKKIEKRINELHDTPIEKWLGQQIAGQICSLKMLKIELEMEIEKEENK